MKALGPQASFHDVRVDGISMARIKKWAKASGWEMLLNTRSTTWRTLDDSDKSPINENTAVELMEKHPTLIKRPVIERNGIITVGWSKDVQNQYDV